MDSTSRQWVLKPLSPLLQPSDLRTIAGSTTAGDPDLNKVVESPDRANIKDEWESSSPSSPSSSSGSQCGFYSFVEDPASPEAEMNEVWMSSVQRQTQLLTLKQERRFKLQTYTSNRKPESLFSDSKGDSRYQIDPQNVMQAVKEEEEKELRKEIIRSQAPKKNAVFKEQLQSLQKLDRSRSPISSRLASQFTLSGTIDREQLNFRAAQKQFLKTEWNQLAADLSLSLQDSDMSSLKQVEVSPSDSSADRKGMVSLGLEESLIRQSSVFRNLNSSLEELSVGSDYTIDEGVFKDNTQRDNRSQVWTNETPIEKEIRLLQEREEDLRRSRGLKHSDGQVEMVKIKTKGLQFLTPIKTKDKSRASFFIQREIQENQSRAEPEQQGGSLGLKLPDAPQQQAEDKRTEDEDNDGFLSSCCPHRHPEETKRFIAQRISASSSDTMTDSRFYQDRITSSSHSLSSPSFFTPRCLRENLESTGLHSRGQGAPDFIEKEIKEALRREQELRELRQDREKSILSTPPPLTDKLVYLSSYYSAALPLAPSSRRRDILLDNSESYAGIHIVDDVNNKVVESTRVLRHKNQRALRWEAGLFANLENQ